MHILHKCQTFTIHFCAVVIFPITFLSILNQTLVSKPQNNTVIYLYFYPDWHGFINSLSSENLFNLLLMIAVNNFPMQLRIFIGR